MSNFFAAALHRREREAPEAEAPGSIVHQRRVTALVLTAFTVVLGIALVSAFGLEGAAAFLPMLPMTFVLLWVSTSAVRFDERALAAPRA